MSEPGTSARLPSPAAVFLAVGGVYVAQSIISGVTFFALPAVLRDRGMALDQVGLIYLAVLPWALKFLWAPAIEKYRLPAVGASRSREVVVAGGLVSAIGMGLTGFVGLDSVIAVLACLIVVAFAAATVDIACDGFAVEALAQEHYGWGNSAQVGGAYLGSALGSGLFLVLVDRFDWALAVFAAALLLAVLGLPFAFGSATRGAVRQRDHIPSLRDALRRRGVRTGIVLAAVYVAAQKWGLTMLGPYLVDAGIGIESIGLVNGVGGMAIGLAGAALGGAAVRRYGAFNVMTAGLALQTLVFGTLAVFAMTGSTQHAAIIVLALASSAGFLAFSFVALYAEFMQLSDPKQGGVDFTLFQCSDALVSMVGGVGSGWIAQNFGHGATFATAASVALIAIPIVHRLRRRGEGTRR